MRSEEGNKPALPAALAIRAYRIRIGRFESEIVG
jgi:hypothetical protein